MIAAAGVFAALSLWGAIASDGFLEADACTHYLFARFAFSQPHYLLDVWGRPFVTTLYAVPAALAGRMGVRVTSLIIALLTGWITYRIARGSAMRSPALAMIAFLAQPLVFLHSFSELTELPFALLMALALWAYQARRFVVLALIVGMMPTARPEGFGFLLLVAGGLALHRRWRAMLLLPIPLIAWSWLGWRINGEDGQWWRWLIDHWPYAGQSLYPAGSSLHFLGLWPVLIGPLLFPAMLIGLWRATVGVWRAGPAGELIALGAPAHRRRCRLIIGLVPLMVLIGHSALYAAGKMASNGELRYLLVVSPMWALLTADGWNWVFTTLRWRHRIAWAAVAAMAPAMVNLHWRIVPLTFSPDWRQAESAAAIYRGSALSRTYPRLMTAHPAFAYFLDVSTTDETILRPWSAQAARRRPAGTILIWDRIYAQSNSSRDLTASVEEIVNAGWIRDDAARRSLGLATSSGENPWLVFVSPALGPEPTGVDHSAFNSSISIRSRP